MAREDRSAAPNARHGDPWDDERIEQLARELTDNGVDMDSDERSWPKVPLEPLADDGTRQQSSSRWSGFSTP
ncbi:MAG: hypothetical protein WKF96_17375 [Solirubrobacteraceae bacterium]